MKIIGVACCSLFSSVLGQIIYRQYFHEIQSPTIQYEQIICPLLNEWKKELLEEHEIPWEAPE